MDIRTYAKLGAIPAGLLVAGLIVSQASSAAFTAQTSTGENSFTSTSIDLTNNKSQTAVFSVDDLAPGDDGSSDVDVTYTGTAPVAVKLYAKDGDTTSALAKALLLTITRDSETVFTGRLADLSAVNTFADGLGTWTPSSTETKKYVIAWSLPDSAGNAVQGQTANLTFAWEAQTT